MTTLLEIISPQCKILSESIDEATKERVMRLGVKWQHAGIINANKRRYSKEILQREITRLTPLIEQGKVTGCSYHPKDNGEIDDVSHLWESAKMENDGACVGVIKVLPTSKGRNIQVVVKAGAWLGLSSRGWGTTTAKEEVVDGKKITVNEINSDYVLKSPGDFVLDPSVTDAGVLQMMEAKFGDEIREGIWWASEIIGDLLKDGGLSQAALQRRYEEAVIHAGFKGTLKEFVEAVVPANINEQRLSALYQGSIRAGYRGTFLEFKKSYLGRKA